MVREQQMNGFVGMQNLRRTYKEVQMVIIEVLIKYVRKFLSWIVWLMTARDCDHCCYQSYFMNECCKDKNREKLCEQKPITMGGFKRKIYIDKHYIKGE